jgi:hypothetical protein
MRKSGLALLSLVILTPLLAYGISNVFMLSPKGRAFIAERIARRLLSFEASIEGATWSPWNGITIYGLRMEQPGALRAAFTKPLLSVQSVRIHPDWLALLRKRLVLRGVEIVKPDLYVPIELLSQVPHEEEQSAMAAPPPALAAVTPAPASGLPPQAMASQPPPIPPAAGIDPPGGAKPPVVNAPAPAVQTPNVWINVRGGRLGIVSLMSPSPLFEAAGINGSVPISGKPAKSKISVSRLKGLGQQAPENIDLPLKWTAPILEAGIIGGEMFGFNFKLGGHIALVPGIPFRIDAAVPEQKDREIRIGGKIRANLGKVVSQGRMQGYLQAPASWQGQWIAQTTAVDVEIEGHKNRFDYGRALLLFQNGAIRCLDARLCSDETTIIGNGMLLSDGRMAAITRIVAAPETLVSISRFTQPDPNATDPVHLTPLSTPQRSALDLQIFGRPGNLLYKPNPMAAPIRIR